MLMSLVFGKRVTPSKNPMSSQTTNDLNKSNNNKNVGVLARSCRELRNYAENGSESINTLILFGESARMLEFIENTFN